MGCCLGALGIAVRARREGTELEETVIGMVGSDLLEVRDDINLRRNRYISKAALAILGFLNAKRH